MRLQCSALAIGLLLATAPAVRAQPAGSSGPPFRIDVTGSIGWFNADKSEVFEYNEWYNRSLFGGVSFGWYWTDHLKTEFEAGVSSRAEREQYFYQVVNNRATNFESTFHFATRRVALGQQYQFLRNAWFHPYIGAGVDLTWETIEHEDGPVTTFDIAGRTSSETRPAVVHPNRTEQHTRPFATFGFKTYMTPRSFFRADTRFVFRDGVDEVLLRMGFGVDF